KITDRFEYSPPPAPPTPPASKPARRHRRNNCASNPPPDDCSIPTPRHVPPRWKHWRPFARSPRATVYQTGPSFSPGGHPSGASCPGPRLSPVEQGSRPNQSARRRLVGDGDRLLDGVG